MTTIDARLDAMVRRFDEIEAELANPAGAFDQSRYTALVKERARLEEPVETFRQLSKVRAEIAASQALAREGDDELRQLAEEELHALHSRQNELQERLQQHMLPRDPDDDKDVFIEIRAGAGGDEAGIFAGELARAYMRFAESLGMSVEVASENAGEAGGFREIVFGVRGGDGPYRHFKFESGVHRVQRVPATEAQGRVHTSTATVAVLPQVEEDDTDVEIRPADLQIDTYKSSGAGGQYVNKTESAIRITHVPSGIVVASQQERSQMQNRDKAMSMLRAMLADRRRREQEAVVGSLRRSQVGTGDRSEKIRTYNFPQDRVTDHRIGRNFGNIRATMDGALEPIVEELTADERARLLAGESAEGSR